MFDQFKSNREKRELLDLEESISRLGDWYKIRKTECEQKRSKILAAQESEKRKEEAMGKAQDFINIVKKCLC